MSEEVKYYSVEEALDLADLENGHVFMNPSAGMIVGADWSKKELTKLIKTAKTLRQGGSSCSDLGHGLVAFDGKDNYFIQTRKKAEAELKGLE